MEFIHVQLGPSVYVFCEDHFAQAIEEIFPQHPADLADPEDVGSLKIEPQCDWCRAEKRGRNFIQTINRAPFQADMGSFLET